MCLANVRVRREGREETLLEEVASISISIHDDEGRPRLRLRTLLGDEREIVGRIKEIDFVNSIVLIEEVSEPK